MKLLTLSSIVKMSYFLTVSALLSYLSTSFAAAAPGTLPLQSNESYYTPPPGSVRPQNLTGVMTMNVTRPPPPTPPPPSDPFSIGPVRIINSANTTITQGDVTYSEYHYRDVHETGFWAPGVLSAFLQRVQSDIIYQQHHVYEAGLDEGIEGGVYMFEDQHRGVDFRFWQDMEHARRDLSWRDLHVAVATMRRWVQHWDEARQDVPLVTMRLSVGRLPRVSEGVGELREAGQGIASAGMKPVAVVASS